MAGRACSPRVPRAAARPPRVVEAGRGPGGRRGRTRPAHRVDRRRPRRAGRRHQRVAGRQRPGAGRGAGSRRRADARRAGPGGGVAPPAARSRSCSSMHRSHRVAGALVGSAVGDALGAPFAGGPPGQFTARFPVPARGSRTEMCGGGSLGWAPGEFTDHTQLALLVASSLLERDGLDEADLVDRLRTWADGTGRCCPRRPPRSGSPGSAPRPPWTPPGGSRR